jgi:hypothetical protein
MISFMIRMTASFGPEENAGRGVIGFSAGAAQDRDTHAAGLD